MADEKRPVNAVKKIGSVALVLVGTAVVHFICFASADLIAHAGEKMGPYFWGIMIFGVAIGVGLIYGGAGLWERWRRALGVIFVIIGLFWVALAARAMFEAFEKAGAEAVFLWEYTKLLALLGVPLLLLGGALIYREKSRSK